MTVLKKIYLSAGFSIVCSTLAFSQGSAPIGAAAQMNVNTLSRGAGQNAGVITFDNRYEGVKGSPYFMDSFVPGTIEMKVGNTGKTEIYKGVNLKFDGYSNLLVAVLPDSKDTLHISTTPLLSFSLEVPTTANPIIFKKLQEAQDNQALRDVFFAILYEGKENKNKLVKNIAKKKIAANFKGGYSTGQTYDEIIDDSQYYLVVNGKLQKVKLSKKAFLEAFPQQEAKLKTFISAEKLSMNSEKDFVKALTYLEAN